MGATNTRVFSPEIWSKFLKVYFKDKLYAAKFFMNFSDDLKQGGDMITIPNITQGPDATTFSHTTGAITDFSVSETRTQLTLNTWIHASKRFSDFELARVSGNYNLQDMYLKEDIAFTLAKALDTALIGQSGSSASIQLHTGTSSVNVNNTAIQEAIRISNSYNLDLDGMAFMFHPNAFWGEIMRNREFFEAYLVGKPIISAGAFQALGTIYGIPAHVTTVVGTASGLGSDGYPATSHRNLLIHKRAIVYALANIDGMGNGPRLRTMPVADAAAIRIIGDLAYGKAVLSGYEGVRIISNT